ncbi:MAG: sigma factor-like helix-turn-helix DNA-binding protein [Arcobacteraceae bacterium]
MKNQMFTGSTYTLQEIATILGVSRERVRQIELQAIKKLKHPNTRKRWSDIVDTINNCQNNR